MFSSSVLRLRAQVTGSDGTLTVFNPFAPQFGHRVKVETASGTRQASSSAAGPSYDYQLEAFAAAAEDGAPFPTTAADAIRTMELIDSIYIACRPPRSASPLRPRRRRPWPMTDVARVPGTPSTSPPTRSAAPRRRPASPG